MDKFSKDERKRRVEEAMRKREADEAEQSRPKAKPPTPTPPPPPSANNRRIYDPTDVLVRISRQAADEVRRTIDWWLDEDVAPKLPGLVVMFRAPSADHLAPILSFVLALESGDFCVGYNLINFLDREGGIAGSLVSYLDGLHKRLVDDIRRDPERWRRSMGQ